jgi:hypothetical protein
LCHEDHKGGPVLLNSAFEKGTTMKTKRFLMFAFLTCAMSFQAHADSWRAAEKAEFFSENRQYMLKIEPQPDSSNKPGHCRAALLRGKKEIWSRHLINNDAPVRVFVADSGQYVLTMDEWHSVGKLPVVIYGPLGDLIRVHSTESLGLKDDIQHIKRTISSYWWNEASVSFFGPDDEKFFIRLHWGKWIVLDLRSGDLFEKEQTFFRDDLRREHEQEWEKLVQYRQKTLAKHAIRLLGSENAKDRKTGALVSGQEKLREAIPALRRLLDDKESFSTNVPKEWTRVYFVRKAAKEALEAMGEKVQAVIIEEPDNR